MDDVHVLAHMINRALQKPINSETVARSLPRIVVTIYNKFNMLARLLWLNAI